MRTARRQIERRLQRANDLAQQHTAILNVIGDLIAAALFPGVEDFTENQRGQVIEAVKEAAKNWGLSQNAGHALPADAPPLQQLLAEAHRIDEHINRIIPAKVNVVKCPEMYSDQFVDEVTSDPRFQEVIDTIDRICRRHFPDLTKREIDGSEGQSDRAMENCLLRRAAAAGDAEAIKFLKKMPGILVRSSERAA